VSHTSEPTPATRLKYHEFPDEGGVIGVLSDPTNVDAWIQSSLVRGLDP
jgi:hypothetical protein